MSILQFICDIWNPSSDSKETFKVVSQNESREHYIVSFTHTSCLIYM
jgi:hypothetical protein